MLELWIVRRIAAILPGVILGGLIYAAMLSIASQAFPPRPLFYAIDLHYAGVVASQSFSPHELVVAVPNKFANGVTQQVRFLLDEDTEWRSLEYVFKDTVIVERRVATEGERLLPPGTFVTIQRDPSSDNPFRARGIAYIRRSEL